MPGTACRHALGDAGWHTGAAGISGHSGDEDCQPPPAAGLELGRMFLPVAVQAFQLVCLASCYKLPPHFLECYSIRVPFLEPPCC